MPPAKRVTGLLVASLFKTCADIRFRVKLHYRGPSHKALRCAFGEGLPAGAQRAAAVRRLAATILTGAAAHPGALARVRVHRPTLRRVERLLRALSLCQRGPRAERRSEAA